MTRAIVAVLAMCLLTLGRSEAKDPSADWKFKAIIQTDFRFDPRAEPVFKWRRVRGIATGPLSSRSYAKVQVDRSIGKLRFFDLFTNWTAVKGPANVDLTLGLFFPAFARDGWELPKGIDYAYVTEALGLQFRQGGFQAAATFGKRYQLATGVFNGAQTLLNDPNDRPLYLLSASMMRPTYKARVWGMAGYDGTTALQQKTWMYGVELTEVQCGRLFAEGSWMAGERFGRKVSGAYGDLGWRFGPDTSVFARAEWCDRNIATPGADRTRFTLSAQQRLCKYVVGKWDTQYQADNGDVRGVGQLDMRF
ncbi:MAG: hypothetical protein HZB16_06380 [Armatimonadetes bacterium]|nr:hypothetical protein [Armatimonadota bacterium]